MIVLYFDKKTPTVVIPTTCFKCTKHLHTMVQVSDHVFVFCVLTVCFCLFLRFFYYILNYFRQCGIFLLYFELFPTVWYFSIRFWTISDSVVFFYYILNYFRQCGIFLLDFELFQTVWYFSIIFWTISDSVVFFY
jgi:hypothetical protein